MICRTIWVHFERIWHAINLWNGLAPPYEHMMDACTPHARSARKCVPFTWKNGNAWTDLGVRNFVWTISVKKSIKENNPASRAPCAHWAWNVLQSLNKAPQNGYFENFIIKTNSCASCTKWEFMNSELTFWYFT